MRCPEERSGVRLLATAGDAEDVRLSLAGLVDWLSAPPVAYAHLPFGGIEAEKQTVRKNDKNGLIRFISLEPANIRMTACQLPMGWKSAYPPAP